MTSDKVPPVAVVTSGAVRVGAVISRTLAGAGYDLMIGYRSSEGPALEMQREIAGMGRRCEIVQVDLSEPAAADRIVDATREAFGRLDLLVNSAAGFETTPLLESDADVWDDIMAVNARAPHLVVRAAADLLAECGGSVVNIVDLSAIQPWTKFPIHSVSKAALAHLTRIQARALAPEVRVNAIAPGAVLPPDDWNEEQRRRLAEMAPLKALGSPQDVADAVLYFAGAGFVTGEVLAVDGGRLLGSSEPPS